MVLGLALAGCVFPPGTSPLGRDPVGEQFEPVSDRFRQNPVLLVFTGLGNVLGAIAFSPIALVTAPVEWAIGGPSAEAPFTTGVISFGAHLVGFVTGAPVLLPSLGVEAVVGGE